MNSFEYLEVAVRLSPFTEEGAEVLMAELSDLPFDSFATEDPFLKAYIPTDAYRASDVKVVLSGYDFVAGFQAVPVQGQNWNKAWEESFQPIVVDGTDEGASVGADENVPAAADEPASAPADEPASAFTSLMLPRTNS